LHFRLNKYLIEQSVRFLRRLFNYNSEWTNKSIEIVQISSGSANMVFEQYFVEAEKYPIITVGTRGGNYTQSAFNDLLRIVDDDKISLGNRALTVIEISDVNELQILLPSTVVGEVIRGIDLQLAWTGNDVGGDNINVNVYNNFTTTPNFLGSGSIKGNTSTELLTYFTEFDSNITLTGSDFGITFKTLTNSSYYVAIDNTLNLYKYNQNGNITTSTGSIVGSLYLPAFIRMGTDYQPTLTFKVHAKNDTGTLYNLVELIVMYFTLAKYGQISRASNNVNGLKLSELESTTAISEFLEKGIYIKSIRQGGLEVQKRGDNDIIFSITISIDMFTEWFEDYSVDTIKDITIDSKSFLENLTNA